MFSQVEEGSRRRRPATSAAAAEPPTERLPEGAEAALWSIVEVMPDPRNHLALTRDPTGEVRLSRRQIAEAMAAAPAPAHGRPRARSGPGAAIAAATPRPSRPAAPACRVGRPTPPRCGSPIPGPDDARRRRRGRRLRAPGSSRSAPTDPAAGQGA